MLRLLIIVIILAILIVFALSNTDLEPVWLISFGWHISVGTLVLGTSVACLVFGYLTGWIGALRQRSRARRAEGQVRTLESQIVELHQRLDRLQTQTQDPATISPSPEIRS
ncbi:lipopolysaccharide assembly protein LapA domain-containing protein [Swingsia samuiensis]|uniref:LapA family protein n=1 Tax=Swingsia samuiensis TaxID=1293412 RepID=A0A4Y6UN21_9PROT|nr:LapA family protein [Swingsia samuiensis]QDH17786.1 LapA family protein [Swingsia samuiensis]